MDGIKVQQFHTTKMSKKHQLLDKSILYSLTALSCCLFCLSPFWYPSLCSSLKFFLFNSLPKITSVLLTPKSLFIVGNLIVVVLIGQSKFFATDISPVSDVYYDEYIVRCRSLRTCYSLEDKKERNVENGFVKEICEDEDGLFKKKGLLKGKIVGKRREDMDSGVDQLTLPAEELSRRADNFIARVNRRRRIEARQLVYCNE
ncbi:DUF4408 domain-containing protein [Cephalotus follicularis]|uniref:DUF4408 domain-containing protein n=1 Tax=Cephalotus follicularis TaxID=3775 RepID=A0A1Q3CQ79_CEPFO|nr:DUF4408 domain-containing protein [Cephalotus follicularis]